jgi:hypothetical protein
MTYLVTSASLYNSHEILCRENRLENGRYECEETDNVDHANMVAEALMRIGITGVAIEKRP